MTGLIGVIAQETSRFSYFAQSLSAVDRPDGTSVYWHLGWDVAENTNMVVDEMIRRDADWLWLLNDDHAFSPDTLTKLLAHNLPMVVPLYLQRNPPYKPTCGVIDELLRGTRAGDPIPRKALPLGACLDRGLVPIDFAGGAGMLIRREVFDKVPRPWFESGKLTPGQLNEDFYFCDKVKAAGVEIFCDVGVHLGHCQTSVIWPVPEPDGWTFAFSFTGGYSITVPPKLAWRSAEEAARNR